MILGATGLSLECEEKLEVGESASEDPFDALLGLVLCCIAIGSRIVLRASCNKEKEQNPAAKFANSCHYAFNYRYFLCRSKVHRTKL